MDEGDYTTELLKDKIVVERKSAGDLYGSIIQGHARFVREIKRAELKDKEFFIFVECPRDDFISKRWHGGFFRKIHPRVLAKIIATMEEKYGVVFVWCNGRKDMKESIISLFISKELIYK